MLRNNARFVANRSNVFFLGKQVVFLSRCTPLILPVVKKSWKFGILFLVEILVLSVRFFYTWTFCFQLRQLDIKEIPMQYTAENTFPTRFLHLNYMYTISETTTM